MILPNPAPGTRTADPERVGAAVVVMGIGLGLALFFAWTRYHTQIARGVIAVQDVELDAIGLFTHHYDALHANLRRAIPNRVSPGTLWTLCTITGSVLRIPVLVIIGLLAIACFVRAPREQLRQRLGLAGMQRVLARIHPIGTAWVGHRGVLEEPAAPGKPLRSLDPALRRDEWLARHVNARAAAAPRDQAAEALTAQLGAAWTGPENAAPLDLCLFLILALQAGRQKEAATELLEELSRAMAGRVRGPRFWERFWERPAPVLPRAFQRRLRRMLRASPWTEAEAIMARHAFVMPGLLSLLQKARLRSGVFNSGMFAALQIIDRGKWLVLAAVSYPRSADLPHLLSTAYCIEAAAAIEHWQAECTLGQPIAAPRVDRTVESLLPSSAPAIPVLTA